MTYQHSSYGRHPDPSDWAPQHSAAAEADGWGDLPTVAHRGAPDDGWADMPTVSQRSAAADGWSAMQRGAADDGWADVPAQRGAAEDGWADTSTRRGGADDGWADVPAQRGGVDDGWADTPTVSQQDTSGGWALPDQRRPQNGAHERPPLQQQRPPAPEGEWAPPPPPQSRRPWDRTPPGAEDYFWAAVRNQAANTVRAINATHCHAAFESFGQRKALSPLGVVLFYSAPDPSQAGGFRLYGVTRLNYSGPAYDLPGKLLPGLTGVAQKNIEHSKRSGKRWDPRGPERSLVNGGDLDMPAEATFVGTGLETLHTDQGSWYTVARSVINQRADNVRPRTVFDIPGQAYVLLTDGTALHVMRDPALAVGDRGVRSTRTLDPDVTYATVYPDLINRADEPTKTLWHQLNTLHTALAGYLLRDSA